MAKSKVQVSEPVKTAITRAVRRVAPSPELKFVSLWNGQNAIQQLQGVQFNSHIQTGSNFALIPPIPQGVQVGERAGNKISPKRLVCDFWITPTNMVSSADIVARLFILESLNVRDPTQINTVNMDTLLDWGQTQGGFVGYPTELSARVNKDEFKIYMDRVVKIHKAYGQNPDASNSDLGQQSSPQPSQVIHIRVSLKCPKVLHYAGGASTLPDGWAPFFNCGYAIPARPQPSSPDSTTTRLQVCWTSTLYYTDA